MLLDREYKIIFKETLILPMRISGKAEYWLRKENGMKSKQSFGEH